MSEESQSHTRTEGGRCPFSGKSFNPLATPELDTLYPFLARARKEEPVFFSEPLHAWVVTRYEDLYAVLQDSERFSSEMDPLVRASLHPEARAMLEEGGYRRMPLLFEDAPSHSRSRGIVARLFAKDAIAALEPCIRAIAHELVDGFIQDGQVDLASRFTYPLPIRVIFAWMGLPLEKQEDFRQWAFSLGRLLSFHPMTLEEQKTCVRNVLAMQRYVAGLITERRTQPREDGLTVLAQRLGEEAGLDEEDLAAVVMLLISAGHETTTSLLGLAVQLMVEHPGFWDKLGSEPQLAQRVVEEVLRHQSPVLATTRLARVDVELSGKRIPAGSLVMLFWPGGNRDEERFPEPERFDPQRTNTLQHLSFGKGRHVCLGAMLARMEARISLEVLSQRLRGVRFVDQPQYLPGVVRHFSQLLLAWEVPPRRTKASEAA